MAQADIADYRAHGFDLVLLNYYFGAKENPDGTFTYGLSTLPEDLERLKGLGSDAPVVLCFEYTCRNWEHQFAEPGAKHVPGTFSPKARKAIVGLVQHKWVIEDQIKGAQDLNYDPARGPVKAPWLSWGPYFWSHPDGTPRRYDGFVWSRADVAEDGLHPSLSGLTKYANMLLHQMTTDPTATPWFLRPGERSAFEILEVGRWSNPPTKISPLATHRTYQSTAMKVEVGYTIYLPPGYATNAARYPVVYWLPGGGCNEDPDSPSLAPGLLSGIDAAIRGGKLPPLMFVIVNGGRYTRYYDSLDGTVMMETTIIRELIPHIDTTYRTVASREGRAIQGESMGGMGTLKFAFKYPELFSSAVAFCPALLDAAANMKRNPTLIPALFNGDQSLFAKDSPTAMLVTNADKIRGQLAIKIVIGSDDGLLEWSEKLHASMVKLKISHEFEIVGGVGHDFGGPKGKYEHQLRALRYAAEHFVLPQQVLGGRL